MKSTMLAIVVTMVISALYSFQNIGNITVKFLLFEWTFPQGVWEITLFCAGNVLMWFFSLLANRETKNRYKKQINELNEKLQLMERDKQDLIASVAAAKVAQDAKDNAYVDNGNVYNSSADSKEIRDNCRG